MLIHGVPLHDSKVGVWMNATEIIGPISFWDHNSHQLATHSLDTISFNTCLITNEHTPFPARHRVEVLEGNTTISRNQTALVLSSPPTLWFV